MLPDLTSCNIAVIGLGYVGLPLALEFSKVKICLKTNINLDRKVTGFDIDGQRIQDLKKCIDITNELSKNDLPNLKNIKFTSNLDVLKENDVFIISVPTPIKNSKTPDLSNLKKACKFVGDVLGDRANSNLKISENEYIEPVVIFESTVYPGMTEEICVPIITGAFESKCRLNILGNKFLYGYSPERINPGDKIHNLTKIVKVTSGCNSKTLSWIDDLYGSIIEAGTKPAPNIKVAEAAKVIENTQRDLNIALINELAVIFNHLKIDTLDVLDVASTKWNFINFKPGLVGGHCIGVDPYYLTYKAQQCGYYPEVVLAGRRINDNMGRWIVEKIIRELFIKGIKNFNNEALLLGFTFKENCNDIRNTKVIDMISKLEEYNIKCDVVDPFANKELVLKNYKIEIENSINNSKKYGLIILAVAHEDFVAFDIDDWKKFSSENCLFVDIKGIIPRTLNPLRI